jgi:hypothetical protein
MRSIEKSNDLIGTRTHDLPASTNYTTACRGRGDVGLLLLTTQKGIILSANCVKYRSRNIIAFLEDFFSLLSPKKYFFLEKTL